MVDVFIESNLFSSLSISPKYLHLSAAGEGYWGFGTGGLSFSMSACRGGCVL